VRFFYNYLHGTGVWSLDMGAFKASGDPHFYDQESTWMGPYDFGLYCFGKLIRKVCYCRPSYEHVWLIRLDGPSVIIVIVSFIAQPSRGYDTSRGLRGAP
jgi:hypothetical protein